MPKNVKGDPLDRFKVLCEKIEPAFVGYRGLFIILDTKEQFHRQYDTEPNIKPGNVYVLELTDG